jgi:uncharacterized membrane protein
MTRRLALLATILTVAVITHFAVVLALPRVLTTIAANRISQNGELSNRWIYPPRATEASREIVRPSPDLAYAACVFDLRDGPVRITVTPGAAYTSLTLYAPNTDATVINAEELVELVVARPGQAVPTGPWRVHRTSAHWGVALQRRLAPTHAAFSDADRLRRRDQCEPLLAPRSH